MSNEDTLKFDTPVGELQWVFITGRGKKNLKDEDVYAASVVLPTDSEACQEFIKLIEDFWEAHKPKAAKKLKEGGMGPEEDAKSLGFKPVLDDAGNETGFTSFNLWTGLEWPDGKPKSVKVFNAKGAEVSLGTKKIGNGSRGRLKGLMKPYSNKPNFGVSMFLTSVQLTKFIPFEGDSFDEVEDEDGGGFEGVDDDGMGGVNDTGEGKERPRL